MCKVRLDERNDAFYKDIYKGLRRKSEKKEDKEKDQTIEKIVTTQLDWYQVIANGAEFNLGSYRECFYMWYDVLVQETAIKKVMNRPL